MPMLDIKNIEKLKQLMSELSDAIIKCTDSNANELDVKEMIVELSSYTNYDISAHNLNYLNNDELMTILANIVRRAVGVNYELSIEQMITYITDIISEAKVACKGKCYSEFEKAYSEASAGSTIKLLKDIELTVPSASNNLSLIIIDKSIIIDANNHWIMPIFGKNVFDIVTKDAASYFKLLNCSTINGTVLVHLSWDSYCNIELNNVYATEYSHLIYTRRTSYGNVTLLGCAAIRTNAAAAVILGTGGVEVINCFLEGSGHALQSEVSGSTVIKGCTITSSQKDFAVVRRYGPLDIFNSYIKNTGTGGLGVGIYCPTGGTQVTLYGSSYVYGTISILSASTVKFGRELNYIPDSKEYEGADFVVIYSTHYYFYPSLQEAEEKQSELTATNNATNNAAYIYAATKKGLEIAKIAGYEYEYNSNINAYLLK